MARLVVARKQPRRKHHENSTLMSFKEAEMYKDMSSI